MTVGFALCGSFCCFGQIFPVMERLAREHTVIPIFSDTVRTTDSRFGSAGENRRMVLAITGREPLDSIPAVEPIGPRKMLDALVVAPCTGNTLAKLAHSIADTPVTMAVKSHLRNGRPVVVAVSTNDGLAGAAENIGKLLARKHYYFVPFGQDDSSGKPTSLVADFARIPDAVDAAVEGRQIQPILL